MKNYPVLSKINYPNDLKSLTIEELILLCDELRDLVIDVVSTNSGHLGANLGVVELTVALHYVFNAPYDKIIWDVGHQAYCHKILTGRKNRFHTNRKLGGISGFPKMSESEYDAFGTGHSSTSISAALGITIADRLNKINDRNVVAVIGDGALTGGMAFEAINHAGIEKTNLLVILNDNNISIDPSVGALKEYLTDITTSPTYNKLRNDIWNLLGKLSKIGPIRDYAQKLENALKSLLMQQGNFFEALNFRYFGPIDGHDLPHLIQLLEDIKKIQGPRILHVITKKGKGFKFAETNQTIFHSPGRFDKDTGEIIEEKEPHPPLYQDVFGYTILELAEKNDKIVGITPAMPTGCSLKIMMDVLPHRTFDVGIAEQHAVTFAAGLATQGIIPYCNIYSTFLQRAYDQIIHDVAIQNLHVVFCIDRAGLVGQDGPTHHGAFDIAFLRPIPNMIISAPMDEIELRNLLYTAQLKNWGPFAIRYPKGYGVHINWRLPFQEITIGKGRILKKGNDLAILSIGHVGNFVMEAIKEIEKEGFSIAHYDMRFIKPIDTEILHEVFKKFDKIITVEDGVINGGFGSAVVEFMVDNNYNSKIVRLGIPDKFVEQGTQMELYKICGYDAEGIYKTAIDVLKKSTSDILIYSFSSK